MFFTKLGSAVAWLIFAFAAVRISAALYIMVFIVEAEEAALWSARYFFSKSPDLVVTQTLPIAGGAIALGILVEISLAVRRT